MGTRVIGLGQRLAGDDAVGLEILDRLRAEGVPRDVELLEATDAASLVSMLETPHRVLIVDAVLGAGMPGEIVELDEADLPAARVRLLSTHGLDVGGAIALARTLFGAHAAPSIRILGVPIAEVTRGSPELSPAVGAVIARVASVVRDHATRPGFARGSAGLEPATPVKPPRAPRAGSA